MTQLYEIITELVSENAKVLDLGCGDGTLLKMLVVKKHIKGTGVEIDQEQVIKALEKGLSIIQGDIDEGLRQFLDKSYDYCILNQTLQSTEKPDFVIEEMLRVARKCVVSFPNFAHWRVRLYLFIRGKMPKGSTLPYEWYNTPNIHLLTVSDFFEFCKKRDIKISSAIYLTKQKVRRNIVMRAFSNFFSEEVVFIVEK
ncbi:hypothetical protein tpqmel_0475 [Candidatus Gastranaerophilus sp. (ex Termes propinquus)]|nr:hypothetical protein tpqmel_0475 [Candidatus Gastranaerophilus sp. (ex Termes propinquus)]